MSDRRNFLKAGLAGIAAVPVLSSLAGCQTAPVKQASTSGSQSARAGAMSTAKVTERVRIISGVPGNVIVLNSGDGLLLVDTGSPQQAPAVLKSVGGKVRTLFNTHYHADQTGGNALFAKAGAEIHAHTITKQWLAADYYVPADDRWVKAPPKEAVPTKTFRGRGEMKAGTESIEFGYLLEAHTRGDAYVYFRDSNVLVAGDVVSPLRDPVLDWYAGGWLGGRADALDDLLGIGNDQTLVVPAYGKVMTRAELQAERDFIAKLYDTTSNLYHHGNSAKDMMDKGVMNGLARQFQDPAKFLYDVVKGLQAHYTNFGGNVV
ncbi:MAG TPA: MBL fold metallo-hydrolase [Steroidobacteraceae bacterium]|nr:MBL fold metallo-hydrolase [Steroidobacteraceae bacterium]